MNKTISLMAGLAALVAGCATAPAVRTQSAPEESRVSTRAESTSDKFSRLKELDPYAESRGGATSFEEYVMSEGTRLELASIGGICAGRIKVITDGEGHFLSEGSHAFYRDIEATRKVLKEADADTDKIITSDEAEELSQRVVHQYTQKVSKEEFKQRWCNAGKKINLSRCDFPHERSLSHCEFNHSRERSGCEFDYSRERSGVEFDYHRKDTNCEFDAHRNEVSPQPCKDRIAVEYKAKAEKAKQTNTACVGQSDDTYTVCVKQSNAAFATCTAEAEQAYQQCLSRDITDWNSSSFRGRGAKVYKDDLSTWGVDETSEPPTLFERVYDNGE